MRGGGKKIKDRCEGEVEEDLSLISSGEDDGEKMGKSVKGEVENKERG